MKNFLFEQYGYYPKDVKDNTFVLDGWKFSLIETIFSSDVLDSIDTYIDILNKAFNKGPYIIKNKFGDKIVKYNEENYTLISIKQGEMEFEDLIKFHDLFFNKQEYVELDKILETWKERVERVEKNLNSSLRVDSAYYKDNIETATFSIGLAINAMQYLSDIIHNYGNKMYGVSVVHKRLKDLNSFDFLNPFNFIVEHPFKDAILLYQNEFIDSNKFIYLLDHYNLDIVSASFVMARLLYRVDIFDALEIKKDFSDNTTRLNSNITKELQKIKQIYTFLKSKYSIRPLDWLEEN